MNEMENNNQITLVGYAVGNLAFSHVAFGEKFHTFEIRVPRISGAEDILPVMVSERLFDFEGDSIDGVKLRVFGQIRTYNTKNEEKTRLVVSVFALDIEQVSEDCECANEAFLNSYICRQPNFRVTPLGREITDVTLAVNRAYRKSDYIPTVCWGRNAKYVSKLPVGTELMVIGRLQSRPYYKKLQNGSVEQKTAYELSVHRVEEITEENYEEQKMDYMP